MYIYTRSDGVVAGQPLAGENVPVCGGVLYPGRKGGENTKRTNGSGSILCTRQPRVPLYTSGLRRRAGICSVARSISALAGVDFPRFRCRMWGCSVPATRARRGCFPIRLGGRSEI